MGHDGATRQPRPVDPSPREGELQPSSPAFAWRPARSGTGHGPGLTSRLPPPSGLGSSTNVGAELDLLLRYQIDRHQTTILGYSHLFPGTFVEQSGPHEGIDLAYLIWQLTF